MFNLRNLRQCPAGGFSFWALTIRIASPRASPPLAKGRVREGIKPRALNALTCSLWQTPSPSGRGKRTAPTTHRDLEARCDVKRGLRQLPWRRPRMFWRDGKWYSLLSADREYMRVGTRLRGHAVRAVTLSTIVGSDKSVGDSFWISSSLGAGLKCGNGRGKGEDFGVRSVQRSAPRDFYRRLLHPAPHVPPKLLS